ncbi:MAG: hypothetical protein H7Y31_02710 [Chitinophagaceae bacterium]|nr:hypothetical protein [Chitinophagaceae bacterium]
MEKTFRVKPEKILTDVSIAGTRFKTLQLFADTVYLLTSPIAREDGEQLIIEPGTVIKSNPGIGISINQGATITANGTIDRPIVFTSNLPPGEANNYWQGITINGKSINNNGNPNGIADDVSGSLQYIRIEFGGLRLNSVGSGTVLNHIQTSYSNYSAGFEFNGGTVDGKYLVSIACGTFSDFYFGNGYTGRLQYLLGYRFPFFGSATGRVTNAISGVYIENNNANPSAQPSTNPLMSNVTMIGPAPMNGTAAAYKDSSNRFYSAALVINHNAGFKIRNTALLGYPVGAWQIADSLSARKVHYLESEFTHSMVHCIDTLRSFYIRRGVYRIYDYIDFRSYMLEPRFNNVMAYSTRGFGFQDEGTFNETAALPHETSVLLKDGNFLGSDFGHPFFDKVEFRGAFGKENWLRGWTNFSPLKSRYNLPE